MGQQKGFPNTRAAFSPPVVTGTVSVNGERGIYFFLRVVNVRMERKRFPFKHMLFFFLPVLGCKKKNAFMHTRAFFFFTSCFYYRGLCAGTPHPVNLTLILVIFSTFFQYNKNSAFTPRRWARSHISACRWDPPACRNGVFGRSRWR